jgi:hypothetical protein
MQASIDHAAQQVDRLQSLGASLVGNYKPDHPFLLSTALELADWEGQLLTLRGLKREEVPYEARTARLTKQIKEVHSKATRSRALQKEALKEVATAQAKADHLGEQYLRQKQKGYKLQEELDEVSKKRPPVFLDISEESSGCDGTGSTNTTPRAKVPTKPRPPAPAQAPPPTGTGEVPAPVPIGTVLATQTGGLPSGSAGPLVAIVPSGQVVKPLGALGALMAAGAAGRKRRCPAGQKGKAQHKSQKEGTDPEGMSDILDEDSH